jgi:hypothetical protein
MDSVLYLRLCYVANDRVLQRLASEVCCDVRPTTSFARTQVCPHSESLLGYFGSYIYRCFRRYVC